jgi:hypothetical protein
MISWFAHRFNRVFGLRQGQIRLAGPMTLQNQSSKPAGWFLDYFARQ